MIQAPNLNFAWLTHGFGLRDSVPPAELTTVKQIHSARIIDACARKGQQIGEADAIISDEPGVTIGIRTADCVPILLADPETHFVACVHAGWRGTAANILGATIDELRSRGCRPESLHVAIGPSIGSCCYEVGPEVARQFETHQFESGQPAGGSARSPGVDLAEKPSKLDLPAINAKQALAAGVKEIWISGECTHCHPDRFFSFRREKEHAGRMLSFVGRSV